MSLTRFLFPLLASFILVAAVFVAPASRPADAVGDCSVSSADATFDASEQGFLRILNAYRVLKGVSPLTINAQLNQAAAWKVNDMATNNYFSHTDSLGRNPFVLQNDCGYTYNTWRAENLEAGSSWWLIAFLYLMQSPPHNDVMLDSHYTVVGIARDYSSTSTFGYYWAVEFGGTP